MHPLFLLVGVFYAVKGELFLFLMSCFVAVQHECAHAFASAKLGYKLNKIVLMPYGAIIDGDVKNLRAKDEIIIALWGPLCNLLTAGFFVVIWWFYPTMYAFTDTAVYSSLSIALVNLLPAYPLDGGRILHSALVRWGLKRGQNAREVERNVTKITRGITFFFGGLFLFAFLCLCVRRTVHIPLLFFAVFLCIGGVGNKEESVYLRMDFSQRMQLKKGVELRYIGLCADCPIKDVFRFLSPNHYVVLQIFDERENPLFTLSQNQASAFFAVANSPYEKIGDIRSRLQKNEKIRKEGEQIVA